MGSSLAHPPRRPDGPPIDGGGRDPLSIPADVKASIRILIVDDERTLRESCASVLQMDGYNVTLIGAWCELRADYRNFRVERIASSRVLDEHFDQDNGRLFREWSALPKEKPTG